MAAQKFHLPTMPFKRAIHNGCAINTSILLKAKPYQDRSQRTFVLEISSTSDVALHMTVDVDRPGHMRVNAKLNDIYSSEIEKPVHLPLNKPFVIHIRVNEHAMEIYKDDEHIMDYVHRVNPLNIREVSLEGALIVDEIIFRPPERGGLDQLPAYDEVSEKSFPVSGMQSLSINGSTRPPEPSPGPSPQPPAPTFPTSSVSSLPYTSPQVGFTSNLPSASYTPPTPHAPAYNNNPPYPIPGEKEAFPLPEKTKPGKAPIAEVAPQPAPPTLSHVQPQQAPSYPPTPSYPTSPSYPPTQPPPSTTTSSYPQQNNVSYPRQPENQPYNPYQPSYPPPAAYPQTSYNNNNNNNNYPPPQPSTYPQYPTYVSQPPPQQTTIIQEAPPTMVYPQTVIQPSVYPVAPVYPMYGGYGYGAPTVFFEGGGYHHHHHGHHHHHC